MTWNLVGIREILQKDPSWLVIEAQESLCITNEDGIEAYLNISGEQVLVETLLFSVDKVVDKDAFNDLILRIHKALFPLSSLEITRINDEDFYAAFGALSINSNETEILTEVEMLFANVESMLDAFADYIQ